MARSGVLRHAARSRRRQLRSAKTGLRLALHTTKSAPAAVNKSGEMRFTNPIPKREEIRSGPADLLAFRVLLALWGRGLRLRGRGRADANIVRMAFYLVLSLAATAGLFFLAGADFVGSMQLLIYVGGTLVLLVFGVMLTSQDRFISMKTGREEMIVAALVGACLLIRARLGRGQRAGMERARPGHGRGGPTAADRVSDRHGAVRNPRRRSRSVRLPADLRNHFGSLARGVGRSRLLGPSQTQTKRCLGQ